MQKGEYKAGNTKRGKSDEMEARVQGDSGDAGAKRGVSEGHASGAISRAAVCASESRAHNLCSAGDAQKRARQIAAASESQSTAVDVLRARQEVCDRGVGPSANARSDAGGRVHVRLFG